MKNKFIFAVLTIIVVGTLFQSLTMLRSGAMYDFGIGFWGPTARDGVWHQALVEQLTKGIPPVNPGFSGVILSNYHYYYDWLVAITHTITGISISILIYRVYPVVFSLLFGVGTYYLATLLFKEKVTHLLVLFFAYFGSSFGWIVESLTVHRLGGESAFWINQPVSMNLNPPFAISMVLVICILILILKRNGQSSWVSSLVLIILISTLSEFKIYAGIVVLLSVGIIASYELMFLKKRDLLYVFIPSLVLAAIIFFSQNKNVGSLIIVKPFWFIDSMIDSPDRVGWFKLSQAREAYLATGNWIKYFAVEFVSLGIYLIGNFGTRIIGFYFLIKNFKNLFKDRKLYLLTTIFIVSLVIPLFVIQKGNPWNTIQFSYYALYVLAIWAAGYLGNVLKNNKSKVIASVVFVILLFTPISSYTTFTFAYTDNPPAKLSQAEYSALEFLKSKASGVVITPAFEKTLRSRYTNPFPLVSYDTTAYVSAYSEKAVFIEDEQQQIVLGEDYLSRVNKANQFFMGNEPLWAKAFLDENNIDYIYLPKIFNYSLNNYQTFVKLIFENSEALIYEKVK